MTDPRLKRAFKKAWRKEETEQWTYGLTGWIRPSGPPLFEVTGRPGYIHVRVRQANGAQTTPPARNDIGVPHAADIAVRMRTEGTTLVIDSIIRREDMATTDPPPSSGVPPHLHDARYYTEAESDALYVGQTGDESVGGLKIFTALLTAQAGLLTPSISGLDSAGADLTISSTPNATKGNVNFAAHSTFDELNGRFGIGTLTPEVPLHVLGAGQMVSRVESTDSIADFVLRSYRASVATHARFAGNAALGTLASPGALTANVEMVSFAGSGYHSGAAFGTNNSFFALFSAEAFTSSAQGTYVVFYTTPLGATTRVERFRVDADGNVGIGMLAPAGVRVHIHQTALGGVVQRLQSAATNDDPTQDTLQGRIATTDATPTTLQTIAIPASHTCMLEVAVVARRTGGASGTAEDGAGYILRGVYKNVAGVATIIGAVVQTVVGESVAGYDATLVASGSNVIVQVTGVATTSISWHATTRHWFLST